MDHVVAVVLQENAGEFAEVRLIFGDQNRFRSSGHVGAGHRLPAQPNRTFFDRKVNAEGSPAACLALDLNAASALFENSVYRGQAESSAFSHGLGCKKWLKDVRQSGRIHSVTRVGDL